MFLFSRVFPKIYKENLIFSSNFQIISEILQKFFFIFFLIILLFLKFFHFFENLA